MTAPGRGRRPFPRRSRARAALIAGAFLAVAATGPSPARASSHPAAAGDQLTAPGAHLTTSGGPATARRITPATPGDFVAALFTGLTALTARQDLSRADRAAATSRLLAGALDLGTLARYSAGAGWPEASGPERARYLRLFREWALGVAAGRLADLSAGAMGSATLVIDAVEDAAGDRLVRSRVPLRGDVPLRLDWRLRAGDDGWRIVDVMIQGISFALVHRRMIGGIVARGGGLAAINEALARALDNGGERPDDLLANDE